jgi:choline dehydrogenase-like flavoprotein
MGSCRMSTNAADGPVKPTGETFERCNLYVADGSVLPTSLGINPMVTIEAFAVMIADNIVDRLRKQSLPM